MPLGELRIFKRFLVEPEKRHVTIFAVSSTHEFTLESPKNDRFHGKPSYQLLLWLSVPILPLRGPLTGYRCVNDQMLLEQRERRFPGASRCAWLRRSLPEHA